MDEPRITGIGLASALGATVETAAAAFRGGISRAAAVEWLQVEQPDGETTTVSGHAARPPAEGLDGIAAWLRLGALAWADLWRYAKMDHSRLAQLSADLGLILVLPAVTTERYGWEDDDLPATLDEHVVIPFLQRVGLAIPQERRAVVATDHTGVAAALTIAHTGLTNRRWKHVVVLAIDCYLDPSTSELLIAENRLKSQQAPNGLAPGEAAAALLLEAADARPSGVDTGIRLASCGHEAAPSRLQEAAPHPREGADLLARRWLRVLDGLSSDAALRLSACDHYPDLTGETWRAQAWGNLLSQTRARESESSAWPTWLAASGFGATGAAAAALAICLAIRSFQRGYARGCEALIWSMNDAGDAGVIRLAYRKAPRLS